MDNHSNLKRRSAARRRKLRRRRIFAGLFLLIAAIILVLIITLIAHAVKNRKTEKDKAKEETYQEQDITLGATGCMLLHSPFLESYVDAEGNYDFSDIYTYVKDAYSEPDYMTCELEGCIAIVPQDVSGHPNFRYPDIFLKNLADAGFDLQMIASNHLMDGWNDSLFRTMESYDEQGIAYTGALQTPDSKRYYVADINGVGVGFINYTYGSQGYFNANVLEPEILPYLNMMDTDNLPKFYAEMAQSIVNMRLEGARYIVANIHWGTEYQLEENETQDRIAQRLCDMGVDAIIGGHPHCVQPIDYLTSADGSHKMFVIYSTGNAVSNQRAELMDEMPEGHTEDGVIVKLSLHQDKKGNVTLTDANLIPTWVYKQITTSGTEKEEETQQEGTEGEAAEEEQVLYGDEANVADVRYWILPLDDIDGLEARTGLKGIKEPAQASYKRTMEVLEPGLNKVKEQLGNSQ